MLTTPIDAHLPLLIALVLVCAWVVRKTAWAAPLLCAVPLLIAAMMMLREERTRLLAYGVIVALAYGVAAVAANIRAANDGEMNDRAANDRAANACVGDSTNVLPAAERWRPAGWLGGVSPPEIILTIAGIVLLRWIPINDVRIAREIVVLTGSLALLFAMPRRREPSRLLGAGTGATPAILIAVLAVAVATPARAGLMTLLPFAVAILMVASRALAASVASKATRDRGFILMGMGGVFLLGAYFARYSLATVYLAVAIVFLVPMIERARPLTYAAALVVLALWPWSGIVARSLPIVRNYTPPVGPVIPIPRALAAGESLPIGVPPAATEAVITTSLGHGERLRAGRVVGAIEATDHNGRITTRTIRIGDTADFGFMRREQFFASRNPMPRFSPGEIRDYGANAWVVGAGRTAIACPAGMVALRVVADASLRSQARLQVESVEFPPR